MAATEELTAWSGKQSFCQTVGKIMEENPAEKKKLYDLSSFFMPGIMCSLHNGRRGDWHDSRVFAEIGVLRGPAHVMDEYQQNYRLYGDSGYVENGFLRRRFFTAASLAIGVSDNTTLPCLLCDSV